MRALIVLLLAVGCIAGEPPLAIVGATAIDPASGAVTPAATVLIVAGRIAAIGVDVAVPAGATRLDARGRWLLPGYVDAHVHFFQSGGLYTRPDCLDLRRVVPYADEVARIRAHLDETLRRFLRCGITAVADVGGPLWNFAVRERADGLADAPHVAVTGPLLSPLAPPELACDDPPIIQVDSEAEAVARVREQAERHPDFVKIWWLRDDVAFTRIARAIIAESHRLGLRVAVHATELAIARAAVDAGADVLVHSVRDAPLDETLVRTLVAKRIPYCGTLAVHDGYGSVYDDRFRPTAEELAWADPYALGTLSDLRHLPQELLPPWLARVRRRGTSLREDTAIAARNCIELDRAGGVVAVGTDAGNTGTLPGPAIFREFAALRAAGMEPMAILRGATLNGARLMGRDGDFGALRTGLIADLVLLDGDPLADIANASRIWRVVRGGVVLDPATLVPDDPAAVAQRGLDVIEAGRFDVFPSLFSDDGVVDRATVSARVHDVNFAEVFRLFADGHRELVRREVDGDRVVDTTRQQRPSPLRPRVQRLAWRIVDGRARSLAIADAAE